MTDAERAIRDAEEAAEAGGLDGMIGALASRVGGFASASAVYGEPVDQDGVTVVPVARVRWGFGGGGGSDASKDGDSDYGGGGGGGVTAHPVGFIELRDGEAEFRPIKDPAAPAMLVIAAGVATWLVLRGLKSLFR